METFYFTIPWQKHASLCCLQLSPRPTADWVLKSNILSMNHCAVTGLWWSWDWSMQRLFNGLPYSENLSKTPSKCRVWDSHDRRSTSLPLETQQVWVSVMESHQTILSDRGVLTFDLLFYLLSSFLLTKAQLPSESKTHEVSMVGLSPLQGLSLKPGVGLY